MHILDNLVNLCFIKIKFWVIGSTKFKRVNSSSKNNVPSFSEFTDRNFQFFGVSVDGNSGVSAGQWDKLFLTTLGPEHTDAFDGFWGKVRYFLVGPDDGNSRYDMNGNYRGPAPIIGIAPTPGFKGGNLKYGLN